MKENLPKYLHWDEKVITDFSDENISDLYDRGYVFTRLGRGIMHQTRSARVDLSVFVPSSENRRVLKKITAESIEMSVINLPMQEYDWSIAKMAKDFYEKKFGEGVMSASKIKELLTSEKSNFNLILKFSAQSPAPAIGFAICYESPEMTHYSYPFYDMEKSPKDMGLGMMTSAILWAKETGKKYIYLGSLQRPGDSYKLQFTGIEWFDGKEWQKDIGEAKEILKK